MLNTQHSPTGFEIRIIDAPAYTISPAMPKVRVYDIGRMFVSLLLLVFLAIAGSAKTAARAVSAHTRRKVELFYMLIPAVTVMAVVIAEDSLHFLKEWVL